MRHLAKLHFLRSSRSLVIGRQVNAFRSMVGPSDVEAPRGIFLAAMSESIAVGKLPPKLPGVPQRCRFQMNRYSPKEAWTTMLFYQRYPIFLFFLKMFLIFNFIFLKSKSCGSLGFFSKKKVVWRVREGTTQHVH